jgi:hypothetical protein
MMAGALFIAGAIMFHAAWTTNSSHDKDLALAMFLAVVFWAASVWLAVS